MSQGFGSWFFFRHEVIVVGEWNKDYSIDGG
jgi:hypothetical protein